MEGAEPWPENGMNVAHIEAQGHDFARLEAVKGKGNGKGKRERKNGSGCPERFSQRMVEGLWTQAAGNSRL